MSKEASDKIRILIVDDHPVVRAGLASMLGTQQNLDVVGAAWNGQEAFALIEQHRPHVMLLDLRMPGMDGIQTLQALRSFPDPPRVLMLTNFESDEDVYRAVSAGAQGYLLKSTTQREVRDPNRTAEGDSVVILVIVRCGEGGSAGCSIIRAYALQSFITAVEPEIRIQSRVAKDFVTITVELIATTLSDKVFDSTRCSVVIG